MKVENDINMITVGYILKKRRSDLGLDLADIAKETRISVENLQALEANDFDKFDSDVFVSGFIKIYAEFLGLDVEKVLAIYRRSSKPKNSGVVSKTSTKRRRFDFKTAMNSILTPQSMIKILITLAVFVVVTFFYVQFRRYQAVPQLTVLYPQDGLIVNTNEIEVKGSVLSNTLVFVNDKSVAVNDDNTFSYKVMLQPGNNTIVVKAQNISNKSRVSTKTVGVIYEKKSEKQQVSENMSHIDGSPEGKLRLSVKSSAAWIQLVVDDKQVEASILKNGYSKEYRVKESFSISTGRPNSTMLYWNGKQLNLKRNTTTGTASLACTISEGTLDCN